MGTCSDVRGTLSDKMIRKTENERRTVMESESFSPASVGTMKTTKARSDNTTQGRISVRT